MKGVPQECAREVELEGALTRILVVAAADLDKVGIAVLGQPLDIEKCVVLGKATLYVV